MLLKPVEAFEANPEELRMINKKVKRIKNSFKRVVKIIQNDEATEHDAVRLIEITDIAIERLNLLLHYISIWGYLFGNQRRILQGNMEEYLRVFLHIKEKNTIYMESLKTASYKLDEYIGVL